MGTSKPPPSPFPAPADSFASEAGRLAHRRGRSRHHLVVVAHLDAPQRLERQTVLTVSLGPEVHVAERLRHRALAGRHAHGLARRHDGERHAGALGLAEGAALVPGAVCGEEDRLALLQVGARLRLRVPDAARVRRALARGVVSDVGARPSRRLTLPPPGGSPIRIVHFIIIIYDKKIKNSTRNYERRRTGNNAWRQTGNTRVGPPVVASSRQSLPHRGCVVRAQLGRPAVRRRGDGGAVGHLPGAVAVGAVPAAPLRHDARVRGGQPLAVDAAALVPELAAGHGVARRRPLLRPAQALPRRRIRRGDNVQARDEPRDEVRRGGGHGAAREDVPSPERVGERCRRVRNACTRAHACVYCQRVCL